MNENPTKEAAQEAAKEAPAVTAETSLVMPLPPMSPLEADAMRFLYELGKQDRSYSVQEINGAKYVNISGLKRIDKYEPPAPETFNVSTLSGLVKWLKADVDKLFEKHGTLFVHVPSPTIVAVLSPIHGEDSRRDLLATCELCYDGFPFNKHLSQEDFIVKLQTLFCNGENRDKVAAVAGNLRMNQDAEAADDGMSQRITLKDGISTLREAVVENPVLLAPFRTFPEVSQPVSPFILRFKKQEGTGPMAALFEADGGAWRATAIATVGIWLEQQLVGLPIVVIA